MESCLDRNVFRPLLRLLANAIWEDNTLAPPVLNPLLRNRLIIQVNHQWRHHLAKAGSLQDWALLAWRGLLARHRVAWVFLHYLLDPKHNSVRVL